MKKRRYSLSIHITSLFLVLTTLVGVVLIYVSYQHAQQLLSGSVREISHENSLKLQSAFKQSTGPIFTTLDFMALSPVVESSAPPIEETRFLASLGLIFQRNIHLTSLYFANELGEFTIIRPLRTNLDRARFEAPDKATMLINVTNLSGLNEFFFLDGNYEQIGFRHGDASQFNPTIRPWFVNADRDGEIRVTEPYFFYFLRTTGISLSRRSISGEQVVGADFTIDSLSRQVNAIALSDSSKLVLFDNKFRALAQHQAGLDLSREAEDTQKRLEASVFKPILNRISSQPLFETVQRDNINWSVTLTPVNLSQHVRLLLAEANPQEDLLANLISLRDKQMTIAIILLLSSIVVVWVVANRLTNPLHKLVQLTEHIARFNFRKTRYPRSMIKEVSDLTQSIELMEHTLHDLLGLLRDTASNTDVEVLAKTITHQSFLVTKAETVVLYMYSEEQQQFEIASTHAIIPFKIDINEFLTDTAWLSTKLKLGEVIHLNRDDNSLSRHKDYLYNSDIYLFPLLSPAGDLIGVLNLGYERPISGEQQDKHALLRELLHFAEIAKDNINQLQQQRELFTAFVRATARAIDTKSFHQTHHCERIPELVNMLAEAAELDDQYFPRFGLTRDQKQELTLSAWLHDCGKIATPEYILDKATRLETVYDRIHEVRMRFEVMKLQAEVNYWQDLHEGGDKGELEQTLTERLQQLDQDFAFVAQCNNARHPLTDEDIIRLGQISKMEWKRTLDDQLGVSLMELQRAGEPSRLPCWEPLLADKPVHRFPWPDPREVIQLQNNYSIQPGDWRFDRGELHNLTVRSGTLTEEERFVINLHAVETEQILSALPYPNSLSHIPNIVAGHHERMDGKGYPVGIKEEQLSIPARILALADVFEALTSGERPYKQGKTLDQAVEVMTEMATSGHIDPKLYIVFLENQLDQQYAERFLPDSQHIEFDRVEHIKRVKRYLKSMF
ncbi:HD domain-containing phosphohydrolase [Vibrio sp.]|uniref:HD domain-containing phosphohydrolase n=1 Tax=Vibrio sp. TaxID=678 RepID=UPI003D1436AF